MLQEANIHLGNIFVGIPLVLRKESSGSKRVPELDKIKEILLDNGYTEDVISTSFRQKSLVIWQGKSLIFKSALLTRNALNF